MRRTFVARLGVSPSGYRARFATTRRSDEDDAAAGAR